MKPGAGGPTGHYDGDSCLRSNERRIRDAHNDAMFASEHTPPSRPTNSFRAFKAMHPIAQAVEYAMLVDTAIELRDALEQLNMILVVLTQRQHNITGTPLRITKAELDALLVGWGSAELHVTDISDDPETVELVIHENHHPNNGMMDMLTAIFGPPETSQDDQ